MIEKLTTGNVFNIVNDWFESTKLSQVISYNVYSYDDLKINKQKDIGKVMVLKPEEIETLEEDGVSHPPQVRIYINTNATDFLQSASTDQLDLVELSIYRLLEGITFNYENGKITYQKPVICEHGGILKKYGPEAVTEIYRVGVEQYEETLKNT